MDKAVLEQYIDACAMIKKTEREIRKLNSKRKRIEQDKVKGSMHEFPYTEKNFLIEGISYLTAENQKEMEKQEQIYKQRMEEAEKVKLQVETWMNTIPQRMQRIITCRVFDRKSWAQVAIELGRDATADSVRMEYNSFMKNKN